jgi:hypothetical protein
MSNIVFIIVSHFYFYSNKKFILRNYCEQFIYKYSKNLENVIVRYRFIAKNLLEVNEFFFGK